MSDDEDPEVIRDLQLRAASEHDSSRSRTADYDWKVPQAAAAWVCRNPKCRASVLVTQEAIDRLTDANSICRTKGWDPIHEGEVVLCSACRATFQRFVEDRQAVVRDSMREVIAQLKAGDTNIRVRRKDGVHLCNEREALDQLSRWGHPDVRGFEQSLTERRNSGRGERRSKL